MRLLVTLFFILSFLNANADEGPAKIFLECDDRNSDVVCELKLDVSDGWRIYAHDDANEMFLNIRLDEEASSGVKDIKIDWGTQRVENDTTQNATFYISNTPIKFSFVSFEDNYRAVLDVNYVACNTYCSSFKEQIIHNGSKSGSLLYMILLAVAGGLILNFMPCVLPVIFMKFM
jgi:thiol:disulfide interchange protein